MGQKVNPLSFRLQYFKDWNSIWFYPHTSIFFKHRFLEDYKLKLFLIDFFKSKNICINEIIFSRKQFNILNVFLSISYVYVRKKYKTKFNTKNQIFFFLKKKKRKCKIVTNLNKNLEKVFLVKGNTFTFVSNFSKLFYKFLIILFIKKKNLILFNFFLKELNNFSKKLNRVNTNKIFFELNVLLIYYIKKKKVFFLLNELNHLILNIKKFNLINSFFFFKKLKVLFFFYVIKKKILTESFNKIHLGFENLLSKYQYKCIKVSKFLLIQNCVLNFKGNIKQLKFFVNKNFIISIQLRFYLNFLTKSLYKLLSFYKINWILLIEKMFDSVNYISVGTKKNLEKNLRFNTYIEITTKSVLKKINLLNLNEFYINKLKICQFFNLKNFLNLKKNNINYFISCYFFFKKYDLNLKSFKLNSSYYFINNFKTKIMTNLFCINKNTDCFKYLFLEFLAKSKVDLVFLLSKMFFNQLLLKKGKVFTYIDFFLEKYFLKKFNFFLRRKRRSYFYLKKHLKDKKNLSIPNGYLMICSGRIRNQRKKSKFFFYKGKLLRSSIIIRFNYINETAFTKNGSFGLKIYKSFEKVNLLKVRKKVLQQFYNLDVY